MAADITDDTTIIVREVYDWEAGEGDDSIAFNWNIYDVRIRNALNKCTNLTKHIRFCSYLLFDYLALIAVACTPIHLDVYGRI